MLQQPLYLRVTAKIISYIFHPLFIPSYIFFWLVIRLPYAFAGITPLEMFARKINVIFFTALFPALSVFLLWRLKFIDNIFLRTQKERIAPYIITMFFYWWMWYLSRSSEFSNQPVVLKFFYFGIFLATVFGLIINNFMKISMHAMGVGGAVVFVLLTCFYYEIYLGADISAVILFMGLVCTARLLSGDHSDKEVYGGLLVGFLCQIIAYAVMM